MDSILKKIFVLGFLVVVSLSFLTTGARGEDKLLVAVVGPLTGSAAEYGTDQFQGVKLAQTEINEKGGVAKGPLKGAKFELVSYDDKGDPKEGANNAQKIVTQKDVFCVIGPQLSSVALAMAPIYERAKMVMFSPYATNPNLTKQGYKYVFRNIQTGETEGPDYATKVVKKLGYKNIGFIYENTGYGMGMRDPFINYVKELGATIVGVESYIQGQDKDFSTILTKLRAKNPDCLFLGGIYTEEGVIVKQARAMGWNVPIVCNTGANHPSFVELAGDSAEGVHFVALFNVTIDNPKVKAFVKAYEKMFRGIASESAALAYDAFYTVNAAIEAGSAKRESLAEYLHKTSYDGVTGKTQFDEKGDVVQKSGYLMVVKNGKFVAVE